MNRNEVAERGTRLAITRPIGHSVRVAGLPGVSFHDAEVLRVELLRVGPTIEFDMRLDRGAEPPVTYRLRFTEVSDVELAGLNEQNVLFDLTSRSIERGWRIDLKPTYGLGGSFVCGGIELLGELDGDARG